MHRLSRAFSIDQPGDRISLRMRAQGLSLALTARYVPDPTLKRSIDGVARNLRGI